MLLPVSSGQIRLPHSNGGFTYQGATPNVRMTGAGLIALAFADVEPGDDRVQRARDYLAKHWATKNVGDAYAMYAVMKGAKLTGDGLESFGEHDWRTEYGEHLYRTQTKSGGWAEDEWAKGALATAWPALILSQDVFATARPAELSWWVITAVAGGVTLLAGVLLLVLCIKHAAAAGVEAARDLVAPKP